MLPVVAFVRAFHRRKWLTASLIPTVSTGYRKQANSRCLHRPRDHNGRTDLGLD